MGFIKKQIVWLILALILVVEGVFLFFLLDKQGEAATKKKNLDAKIAERARLVAQNPGDPAVLAVLGQKKRDILRERGEALIALWFRSQAISHLFPDVKDTSDPAQPRTIALAERDHVRPWQEPTPASKGVFMFSYQRLYNGYADRLEKELGEVGSDRKLAGLAAPTAFTERTDLGIGDIYLEQARFWIIQAIADSAAKAGVKELEIGEIKRYAPATSLEMKSLAENARIAETFSFKMIVGMQYPRLAVFLADLLHSPVYFRIDDIEEFKVIEPEAEKARWESAEASEARKAREAREGKTEAPAAPKTAAPAVAKGEYRVKVTLACRAMDLNIAARHVRFTGPKFAAGPRDKDPKAAVKTSVRKWIHAEIARVEAELKDTGGEQRWAADCQKAIDEALAAAEKEAAKEGGREKAKAVAIILRDRVTYLQDVAANRAKRAEERTKEAYWGVEYDYDQQAKAANAWVEHYPQFESLTLGGRKELLSAILEAIDADKCEFKDGLNVVFYPEKTPDGKALFDPKQVFEQTLDTDGNVQIEYGFVLFRPRETTQPVRRAGK